jgi:hypothetical protein
MTVYENFLPIWFQNLNLHHPGKVTVALANVPVDENVCCVVEITDSSTRSLLAWCFHAHLHASPRLAPHASCFRCCLPIFEKNHLHMAASTSKGSRPPTSQSVKEITKAGNFHHDHRDASHFAHVASKLTNVLLFPLPPPSRTFTPTFSPLKDGLVKTLPPPCRHHRFGTHREPTS